MTSDARVEKEAASLTQGGYSVTIVATAAKGLPLEQRLDGYRILRVPYRRVIRDRLIGKFRRARSLAQGSILRRIGARIFWILAGTTLRTARSNLLPFEYWSSIVSRLPAQVDLPDVIHAHDLGTLRAAVLLARYYEQRYGSRPRVVYDSHELYVEQLTSWRKREKVIWSLHERRWISKADAVITVSDGIAAELARRYRLSERPWVVLNCPPYEVPRLADRSLRSDCNLDASTPLVVYVGTVKRGRGLETVFEAMTLDPVWHLALVGPGDPTKFVPVTHRIEGLGLRDRVHFVKAVPWRSLPAFIAGADAGIHPLTDDCLNHRLALPNKLFDYVKAGLPVIVTDLPEMSRLVNKWGVGVTFPSGDVTGLVEGVKRVLTTQKRIIMPQELSWEAQESQLMELYERLASR